MKNKLITIMILFLANVCAMEQACNVPLSSYPTIVQAHQTFQEIYNRPNERKELEMMLKFPDWWKFQPLAEINQASFLNGNAQKSLSTLEPVIDDLTDYLSDIQGYAEPHQERLSAGNIPDYQKQSFYHLSNVLYALQKLKYEIMNICFNK